MAGKVVGAARLKMRLTRQEQRVRNKNLTQSIGRNLKTARIELGYKYHEVAQGTGLPESKICEWEAGKIETPIYAISELAVFYGVSIDWLFGQCSDSLEKRSALDLNKMMRGMLTKVVDTWSSVIAVQSQAHDEMRQASTKLLEAGNNLELRLSRCLEINRESFEENWRGGAALVAAIDDYSHAKRQYHQQENQHRLRLSQLTQERLKTLQDTAGYYAEVSDYMVGEENKVSLNLELFKWQ